MKTVQYFAYTIVLKTIVSFHTILCETYVVFRSPGFYHISYHDLIKSLKIRYCVSATFASAMKSTYHFSWNPTFTLFVTKLVMIVRHDLTSTFCATPINMEMSYCANETNVWLCQEMNLLLLLLLLLIEPYLFENFTTLSQVYHDRPWYLYFFAFPKMTWSEVLRKRIWRLLQLNMAIPFFVYKPHFYIMLLRHDTTDTFSGSPKKPENEVLRKRDRDPVLPRN